MTRAVDPATPRLRLIAGPNGAGKTSFTRVLESQYRIKLGEYVNPDEIADALADEIPDAHERAKAAQRRAIDHRMNLLELRRNMAYESVMSHHSHLEFIRQAKQAGYRTYLYYIGLLDPQLCVVRVANRVQQRGHAVPEDKIRSRYHRSLGNLYEMCRLVDRAYLMDNSGRQHVLVAEVEGRQLKRFTEMVASVGGATWLQASLFDKWPACDLTDTRLAG